jgi:hypothetical protein
LDTIALNSDIMASVIWSSATPFSFASDFFSDPRWSIAAAAMTPCAFERAFRCFFF